MYHIISFNTRHVKTGRRGDRAEWRQDKDKKSRIEYENVGNRRAPSSLALQAEFCARSMRQKTRGMHRLKDRARRLARERSANPTLL